MSVWGKPFYLYRCSPLACPAPASSSITLQAQFSQKDASAVKGRGNNVTSLRKRIGTYMYRFWAVFTYLQPQSFPGRLSLAQALRGFAVAKQTLARLYKKVKTMAPATVSPLRSLHLPKTLHPHKTRADALLEERNQGKGLSLNLVLSLHNPFILCR